MLELWKIDREAEVKETHIRCVGRTETLEGAVQLAGLTGPGSYQVCNETGNLSAVRIGATHEGALEDMA